MAGRGRQLNEDSGSDSDSDSDNVVEGFTVSPTIDACGKEILALCCRLYSETTALLGDKSLDSDAEHLNQLKEAIETLGENSFICKLLRESLLGIRNAKKQPNSSVEGTTLASSNSKAAKRTRANFQSPTSSEMKSIPELLTLILKYTSFFKKKVEHILLHEPLQPDAARTLKKQEKNAMQIEKDLRESREILIEVVKRMNEKAHIASNPVDGSSSSTS